MKQTNAHGHPIPAAERELLRGAMPAHGTIAEVLQEDTAPDVEAVLVRFNGPQPVHDQPSRAGAPFTQVVDKSGDTILGKDPRRKRAVIISSDNPFYYSITQRPNASTANSCLWPANVPMELRNGDAVWCAYASGASNVSTLGVVVELYAD
jgi:hypothetical protein